MLNGHVQPGDTVAIVDGGPIGLAALLTARFYSPAEIIMIDVDDNRLEVARTFGLAGSPVRAAPSMARFRPVIAAEAFRYTHLTGLSGEAHREKNRELLVVARR